MIIEVQVENPLALGLLSLSVLSTLVEVANNPGTSLTLLSLSLPILLLLEAKDKSVALLLLLFCVLLELNA